MRRGQCLGLLAGLVLLLGVVLWQVPPGPGEAARALLRPRGTPVQPGVLLLSDTLPTTPAAEVVYMPIIYLDYGGPGPTMPPPSPTPTSCGEIVQNGDLEQGRLSWLEHSAGNYDLITTAWNDPYQGSWVVWFGGYTEPLPLDVITQTIHVPAAAQNEQTLTLYLYVESNEAGGAWDVLSLRFYDSQGSAVSDPIVIADSTAAPMPWTQQQINLTGFSMFAGQDLRIEFRSTADYANITNFVIDLISLRVVCGPGGAPPAALLGIHAVSR